MNLRDQLVLTQVFDQSDTFSPEQNVSYIFATSEEERSQIVNRWYGTWNNVQLIEVTEQTFSDFEIEINAPKVKIKLRSEKELKSVFDGIRFSCVYIDITGLTHNVWAPLVRAAIRSGKEIKVVYTEPHDYNLITTVTEGDMYDLSERTEGVRPIAGFASLRRTLGDKVYFAALLGFEGPRFIRMLEIVDLPGERVVPIIGVPGYRPEYPFRTYYANRVPLTKSESWYNIRFAKANCPFSLYFELDSLMNQLPIDFLRIAIIGTKPHALGAVLFAISHSAKTEILYDHPIRKPKRSTGRARTLVYHISCLPLLLV